MAAPTEAELPPAATDVLDFWYGSLEERLRPGYAHRYDLWFGRSADEEICSRFGPLLQLLAESPSERDRWCATPRGTVAMIVLLDQLNRNVHRGTARMFAHDPVCLEHARRLVGEGRHLDGTLAAPELAHVSICLSHSELIDDHTLNLHKLLPELTSASHFPREQLRDFEGHAHMAKVHADEIRRFGRYPHRNQLLGRECTREEAAWLSEKEYGYHRQVRR